MDEMNVTQPGTRNRRKKPATEPKSVATPTSKEPRPNKYARKEKVGTPQLGNTKKVTTVGLGKLKVTTNYGGTYS